MQVRRLRLWRWQVGRATKQALRLRAMTVWHGVWAVWKEKWRKVRLLRRVFAGRQTRREERYQLTMTNFDLLASSCAAWRAEAARSAVFRREENAHVLALRFYAGKMDCIWVLIGY